MAIFNDKTLIHFSSQKIQACEKFIFDTPFHDFNLFFIGKASRTSNCGYIFSHCDLNTDMLMFSQLYLKILNSL